MAIYPAVNMGSVQSRSDQSRFSVKVESHRYPPPEVRPSDGVRPNLLYDRYGLRENPFGVTPNPRFLYRSKTHTEALASLILGVECGVGFQSLIAPPGMGKTTLLFSVLERFRDAARTAFLFQIHGDSRDLLRYLVSELGGDASGSDVVRMQALINQLLIRERRAGRRTLIIIDEAQSLDTSALETVRLLSNFESPTAKLAHIILAGQPQLAHKLAKPGLAQLVQRISIRTTLRKFDQDDTTRYIEHRLRVANYQGLPLFTPAALEFIWEQSHGVPREINTLCFNALLLAGALEHRQIDVDILREVVGDLRLDDVPTPDFTPATHDSATTEEIEWRRTRAEARRVLAKITEMCEVLSRPPGPRPGQQSQPATNRSTWEL